jgi:CHASE2 domain-containing sensor protein
MTGGIADNRLRQDRGRFREGKLLLHAAGLCLTLAVALLSVFPPGSLQKADLLLYDLMVAGRATPPQSTAPVLVAIDEESLAALGQWPWPRYRLAMLVEQLQHLGAEVVALDILMPEPDRSSPEVIRMERQRDLAGAATPASPADQDSNSQRLAAALTQ